IEALVIARGGAAERVVLWVARLDDDARGTPIAACTTCNLRHQREGVLRRAIVRKVQRQVSVDDPHARDGRKVKTSRHELGADQDVGTPLAELFPDVEVGVWPAS